MHKEGVTMRYYSTERNIQMMIALMKGHNIKRIIASPGTTNVTFIGSVQNDPFFEIYSAPDERSAAYIACGLAAETGEPVAISCTGATASRNYFPGLTEAYYRNLPILAITSSQHTGRIAQNIAQIIDRSVQPNDTVRVSVQIPSIHSNEDEWACNVQMNKALLELKHHGGGPVHINLATEFTRDFSVKELPPFRIIKRFEYNDELPKLPKGKIAIFVGNHRIWSSQLIEVVDRFCERYNGVVLYDHTSNYKGKYGIFIGLIPNRALINSRCANADLMIHIGDVSASNPMLSPKEVWRIHPDGEIRDKFKKLTSVFEMEEITFFQKYLEKSDSEERNTLFYQELRVLYNGLLDKIPELPFSSLWIASRTIDKLPNNSVLHLGILNSLFTWNKYESKKNIQVYSNTGGFGIDGILSTVIGASLVHPDKLYFCVLGDLAFFYDMNVLGNRHVGNNLRIMLVNNGRGHTMRTHNNLGYIFEDEADRYISAAGHYGHKSPLLVKHYAEDLGYLYLTASTKDEYLEAMVDFINPDKARQSIIFEVFTDSNLENDAQELMREIGNTAMMGIAESTVKKLMGENSLQALKKIIKKRGGFN